MTEAAPTMVVVETFAKIEQRSGNHTPHTAATVDRERTERIINLERGQQLVTEQVNDPAKRTNDQSRVGLDVTTASSDGDQTSENTVAQVQKIELHLVLPSLEERNQSRQNERSDATSSCGNSSVTCDKSGQIGGKTIIHTESGSAIESVPAHPQNECTENHKVEIV